MHNLSKNIINSNATIKEALQQLNDLGVNLTLFVVDENKVLLGVLTDGDIRRALLSGTSIDLPATVAMQRNFKFIKQGDNNVNAIAEFKKKDIKILPVLNGDGTIYKLLNLEFYNNVLPIEAVIMAGGKGERLLPLTATTPKPLLPVGGKPIIEYNVDRLISYGVTQIYISVKYLAHTIEAYFGNGQAKEIAINYVHETEPLGTIGAVSNIENFGEEAVLIMNSDLLTNINYEDFYKAFIEADAAMAIATVGYSVNIPYAVLETNQQYVTSLKEKPTYTYHSNAGIYLVKKQALKKIPKATFYNATDLIEDLLAANEKVVTYNILGYWLDIGKHEDYKKAQEDIKHINF